MKKVNNINLIAELSGIRAELLDAIHIANQIEENGLKFILDIIEPEQKELLLDLFYHTNGKYGLRDFINRIIFNEEIKTN